MSGIGDAVLARIGTLRELGEVPGMPSLPSLQRFIAERPDFPLVERGGYGRPFRIDLDAAAAFVRAHWQDGRVTRPQRRLIDPRQPSLFSFQGDRPDAEA